MNLNKSDNRIFLLLEEWNEVKEEISIQFKNRDNKNALTPMMKGINIFEQFLFLCNDRELINQQESILGFNWKPVNITERLTFIKNKPSLYHSFIQLSELMNEQEKQYNKKIAIQKMTKH